MDGHIKISIQINFPSYESQTIILNIQKNTIKEFSTRDKMKSTIGDSFEYKDTIIDEDIIYWSKNITVDPTNPYESIEYYTISLDRKISQEGIKSLELDMMPGFRLTWNYSKMVEQIASFHNEDSDQFVRFVNGKIEIKLR